MRSKNDTITWAMIKASIAQLESPGDTICPNWQGHTIRLRIHNRCLDEVWEGETCCLACALRYLGWSVVGCTAQLI